MGEIMKKKIDRRVQDPKKEVQSRKFWTFVVEQINIAADEQLRPRVSVAGYFALCTEMSKGLERDLRTEPVTPPGLGPVWQIPAWLFGDTGVDEITARTVVARLKEIFKHPFLPIPAMPLDLPIQKIPPSKRDKVIAGLMKARIKEHTAQSPEAEWEDA